MIDDWSTYLQILNLITLKMKEKQGDKFTVLISREFTYLFFVKIF